MIRGGTALAELPLPLATLRDAGLDLDALEATGRSVGRIRQALGLAWQWHYELERIRSPRPERGCKVCGEALPAKTGHRGRPVELCAEHQRGKSAKTTMGRAVEGGST